MNFRFWFRSIWQRHGPKRRLIVIDDDTPPAPIPSRHVYLCRDEGDDWSAAMRCPCGCGDDLELMLLSEVKPNWSLETKNGDAPTLRPSVSRKSGCGSHFWLREGHIHWC